MKKMNLTPNQREALSIKQHICVTAGAGSGKTTVLVDRYLEILRTADVSPEKIVAITFTDKAAAEMKGRIIQKLNEPQNSDIREKYIEQMNTAPISTVHAFCSRILREFPFQAYAPANFSILQGIDQKLLLQQIIKNTLKEIATNPNDIHHSELRNSLQRYGNRKKLVDMFSNMVEKRELIENLIENVYPNPTDQQIPDVWKNAFQDGLPSETDIEEFSQCLTVVLQVARGKNVSEVNILNAKLEILPDRNPRSPDVLKLLKEIADLITIKNGSIATTNFLKKGVDTTAIETEIKFLESVAAKIKEVPSPDMQADKTDDEFLLSTTRDLLTLYTQIFEKYQNDKLAQGKLDFADLQIKTRDLLRNNEKIRRELVNRHKYYMIDEYQDTNELQYQLVMLLTNELNDANLFIVGDPKQSIYGFRGADVRVFDKTKQKIINNDGMDIQLKENFRSLRDTVGFVNHFFERLMKDGSETEFEVSYDSLTKARAVDANGAIEIILGQYDNEEANECTLIAQHIKKMIENEEKVWVRGEDRDEEPRPIKYGDIAILIRSRRHLPDIEHALLSADIPYLTTGGVGFYQRQEIYDVWNYLNFLNAPSEYGTSLVGILRGPAFGISDTELYEISLQNGKSFWEKVLNYQTPTEYLQNAIDTLKNHMHVVHRMPVNQLILTIVNETGMIGTLKLGKQGQQRWANYQKLLELARNFDSDENEQTLTNFIDFLDTLITEEPLEGQAPIEDTSGSVQIMTIHSAKGKQFPVVILPCLNRIGQFAKEPFIDERLGIGFSPLDPKKGYEKTAPEIVELMKERANAKDEAEMKRLFYVGATRAEDRLILSGSLNHFNNLQNMLKWLYEHIGISKENDSVSLPVMLEIYSNNTGDSESFQLNIPIIEQVYDTGDANKISYEIFSDDFPEKPFLPLRPSNFDASFSVTELANYALCPLRYQLENVLRIPPIDEVQRDLGKTEVEVAIRHIFARIKHPPHAENLDNLIETTFENYLKTINQSTAEDLKITLETHINNFLNSELAATAFSATESYTNQQLHADINGHIISSRFDRLFKDQTGQWQIINFKIFETQNLECCKPEMGLYALLFHKAYPNEQNVGIAFYFTEQNDSEQMCFNNDDFAEISKQLQNQITSLQQGIFTKNLEHCCSCPYADSHAQCIVKGL